jgi:hypothetical protein
VNSSTRSMKVSRIRRPAVRQFQQIYRSSAPFNLPPTPLKPNRAAIACSNSDLQRDRCEFISKDVQSGWQICESGRRHGIVGRNRNAGMASQRRFERGEETDLKSGLFAFVSGHRGFALCDAFIPAFRGSRGRGHGTGPPPVSLHGRPHLKAAPRTPETKSMATVLVTLSVISPWL